MKIKRWHWIAIGGLTMILLCGVAACALTRGIRNYYYITMENHSDKVVIMHYIGRDVAVAPCTIIYRGLIEGPPLSEGFRVKVINEQGGVLTAYDIVPGKEVMPPAPVILRYPREGELGCPKAVVEQYMVVLQNTSEEPLAIWFEGEEYRLGSGEAVTLGPLQGSVFGGKRPAVLDASGKDRIDGVDLGWGYDISSHIVGEMPVKEVIVGKAVGF